MEQLIPKPSRRVTEDDYLRMEDSAKAKHEYRQGEIVDMAGATTDHIRIARNLGRQLGNRLEGSPCEPLGSDLRVRISESGNYCYPDMTVVCGPLQYAHPERRTVITNPKLIIEITSPSTEADDRGRKFTDYRTIQTLEEYILISQERAQVETFYRQSDGVWAIGPTITGLDRSVRFRTLGFEIPLTEIYAMVEFPPERVMPDPTT